MTKGLSIRVRETPCKDHPEEEWIVISLDGNVIMELCTGTFKVFARSLRGKDMVQFNS